MNKATLCTGLLLCTLSLDLAAQADLTEGQEDNAAGVQSRNSLPEEIIIIGRDIIDLRKKVDEAENRVYAIFNKLNDDDYYDIHCRMEARLGTKLKSKVCRPNFLNDATREEALGILEGRAYMPPAAVVSHHNPILLEKMQELMLENAELFNAMDEHRVLKEELEAKGRK